MTERTKKCCICKVYRSVSKFFRARKRLDGLQTSCKGCSKKLDQERYARQRTNPPKLVKRKRCVECGVMKDSSEYAVNPSKVDHLESKCRKCAQAYYLRRRTERILTRFNLTLKQYEDMAAKQKNVCAICKQPETRIDPQSGLTHVLSVDHDHDTGKVRGLLCANCNCSLGHVESLMKRTNGKLTLLQVALKYLRQ